MNSTQLTKKLLLTNLTRSFKKLLLMNSMPATKTLLLMKLVLSTKNSAFIQNFIIQNPHLHNNFHHQHPSQLSQLKTNQHCNSQPNQLKRNY